MHHAYPDHTPACCTVRVHWIPAATAHIKIAGASELQMTYEYESINGRVISPAAMSTAAAR